MKKGILLLSAILALGSLSSSAQKRTATMTDEEMYLDAMHHNITTEKIFGYVKQLSDPPLCGNTTGKHYGYPIPCHPRQEKNCMDL